MAPATRVRNSIPTPAPSEHSRKTLRAIESWKGATLEELLEDRAEYGHLPEWQGYFAKLDPSVWITVRFNRNLKWVTSLRRGEGYLSAVGEVVETPNNIKISKLSVGKCPKIGCDLTAEEALIEACSLPTGESFTVRVKLQPSKTPEGEVHGIILKSVVKEPVTTDGKLLYLRVIEKDGERAHLQPKDKLPDGWEFARKPQVSFNIADIDLDSVQSVLQESTVVIEGDEDSWIKQIEEQHAARTAAIRTKVGEAQAAARMEESNETALGIEDSAANAAMVTLPEPVSSSSVLILPFK